MRVFVVYQTYDNGDGYSETEVMKAFKSAERAELECTELDLIYGTAYYTHYWKELEVEE
jgi:hypothetical protein